MIGMLEMFRFCLDIGTGWSIALCERYQGIANRVSMFAKELFTFKTASNIMIGNTTKYKIDNTYNLPNFHALIHAPYLTVHHNFGKYRKYECQSIN